MSELHRGDPLQVSIETATIDGSGVARVDGQVVFVPGALPGERCSVRIAHVGRSAVFAQLLSVLTPSAHRVEPDCPYFPLCGGCALRHMDYEQELALKQAHVQSCLTRIGGQTISALPITGAAQTDGYRNKVQFPVQEQDGRPVAGFFSGKTHRVIPVRHCRIQPDCADAIRGAVLSWMEQYHIRAYDEQTHTGYIRHIYIRFGAESGQILVCIVANCAQLPKKKQLVQTLLAAEPGITTIVFSPNTKKGNTVLGTEFLPLYGDGTITDTLCGLRFRLSAPAFYQVNHAQAERLYEKAVQLPNGGSITIIAVTTLSGGDITHAIPDNTGYITEGQLFLRNDSDTGKVIVDPFRSLSRLKQLVIGKKTREDHPQVMNACVRLYADAANAKTKLENGFDLSDYDERTLKFAFDYSEKLLAIDINIEINQMLDTAWGLFAKYFTREEVAIKEELIQKYWKEA